MQTLLIRVSDNAMGYTFVLYHLTGCAIPGAAVPAVQSARLTPASPGGVWGVPVTAVLTCLAVAGMGPNLPCSLHTLEQALETQIRCSTSHLNGSKKHYCPLL